MYTDTLLTTIYSVDQKVPWSWKLTGHHNVRAGFSDLVNQRCLWQRGDIVIFDRGYYSSELVKL